MKHNENLIMTEFDCPVTPYGWQDAIIKDYKCMYL